MPHPLEYTTIAQRFTGRFPVLAYVGTQASYWSIANLLLVAIVQLQSRIMVEQLKIPLSINLSMMMVLAVVLGAIYGAGLGVSEYYLDKKLFRKISFGKVIVLKAIGSLMFLILLMWVLRFVVFEQFTGKYLALPGSQLTEQSWQYLFYLLLIYYFFITLIINFVNQVNKKFGPGVLAPLMLGRYRNPREEERIFMFMDLKSSTSIAEQVGHLKYSAFIRDCFADINEVLFPYRAQVYQYVGDELVVTWRTEQGLKNNNCIRFYFACVKQFQRKAYFYETTYGLLPAFKAGVHLGKVTAVEIGEVKKDIAYHGDTLNTTARIQAICNEYNKNFLASASLVEALAAHPSMTTEVLGKIALRGKMEKVEIVSVGWTDNQ